MHSSSSVKIVLLITVLFISSDQVLTKDNHLTGSHAQKECDTPSNSTTTTPSNSAPLSNHERMHQIYTAFHEAFIYPNNAAEAKTINSTLLADNIQGRIDTTNTFDGRELNTEYLFGLFANIAGNKTFNLIPVPLAYEERSFISSGNIMATSTLITFQNQATGIKIPLVIDNYFRVNEEGKIDQYESNFKRVDWFVETLFELTAPHLAQSLGIPASNLTKTSIENMFQQLIAKSVCGVHQEHCTGDNQQYDSLEDCIDFIMELPFGAGYSLGQNNAVCRMMHQEMVPFRPTTHCSHIGRSGGHMCIDRDYSQVTEEVYFRNKFIETDD